MLLTCLSSVTHHDHGLLKDCYSDHLASDNQPCSSHYSKYNFLSFSLASLCCSLFSWSSSFYLPVVRLFSNLSFCTFETSQYFPCLSPALFVHLSLSYLLTCVIIWTLSGVFLSIHFLGSKILTLSTFVGPTPIRIIPQRNSFGIRCTMPRAQSQLRTSAVENG